jgi:c-di-GMP-related signal transduction protein
MGLTPIFFLDLLADQNLKPGALALRLGEGDQDKLLPLIEDPRFAALVAAFPCVFGADLAGRLSPELQNALQATGCQVLGEGQIEHSDAQIRPVLSGSTLWLSGNWYLAAPAKSSVKQTASRAISLKLLQCVAADADTCEIEALFRQDPVLAYHLLRLVNSIGIGSGRHVSSFAQAILILGRQQLKRWLNLMLFAASRDDHRSAMLLARATARARRMELLAKACGLDRSNQERAFMAGMFSLLGILFGMPLAQILSPLKLNAALSSAVIDHDGELGSLLRLIEAAQLSDEGELIRLLGEFKLSIDEFNQISIDSLQWMLGVIRERNADA